MGRYLNDARALYEQARGELRRWEETSDDALLRDAAEKAWGAVCQAANELLEAYGRRVPSGTNARRSQLNALEHEERQLRSLRFRDRFSGAADVLHKECFYDGECPVPLVTDVVEDVKEYLDDVATVTDRLG